jgi:ABC-type Fe3+/spermidine/putrescine transport system ATPase subunit
VQDLVRRYDGLVALAGISFGVAAGEIFGFLGPNGAGKTTTIKILTGQLRPSAGRARVMGCDVVTERARLKPQIGVVFEYQNLYQRLSARDNLNFAAVLTTGCVVALGLLLGVLADNPSTLSMWGVGALLGLIGLTAAAFLAPATWPAALRTLLAWLPGAQTLNLLRASMAESVPPVALWSSAAVLAGVAAVTYGLVGVLLRRMSR